MFSNSCSKLSGSKAQTVATSRSPTSTNERVATPKTTSTTSTTTTSTKKPRKPSDTDVPVPRLSPARQPSSEDEMDVQEAISVESDDLDDSQIAAPAPVRSKSPAKHRSVASEDSAEAELSPAQDDDSYMQTSDEDSPEASIARRMAIERSVGIKRSIQDVRRLALQAVRRLLPRHFLDQLNKPLHQLRKSSSLLDPKKYRLYKSKRITGQHSVVEVITAHPRCVAMKYSATTAMDLEATLLDDRGLRELVILLVLNRLRTMTEYFADPKDCTFIRVKRYEIVQGGAIGDKKELVLLLEKADITAAALFGGSESANPSLNGSGTLQAPVPVEDDSDDEDAPNLQLLTGAARKTLSWYHLRCFYLQLLYGLDVAQKVFDFVHNDFHFKNIMLQAPRSPYSVATIYDAESDSNFAITGWRVKIIDCGLSRLKFEGAVLEGNSNAVFNNAEDIRTLTDSIRGSFKKMDDSMISVVDLLAILTPEEFAPIQALVIDRYRRLGSTPADSESSDDGDPSDEIWDSGMGVDHVRVADLPSRLRSKAVDHLNKLAKQWKQFKSRLSSVEKIFEPLSNLLLLPFFKVLRDNNCHPEKAFTPVVEEEKQQTPPPAKRKVGRPTKNPSPAPAPAESKDELKMKLKREKVRPKKQPRPEATKPPEMTTARKSLIDPVDDDIEELMEVVDEPKEVKKHRKKPSKEPEEERSGHERSGGPGVDSSPPLKLERLLAAVRSGDLSKLLTKKAKKKATEPIEEAPKRSAASALKTRESTTPSKARLEIERKKAKEAEKLVPSKKRKREEAVLEEVDSDVEQISHDEAGSKVKRIATEEKRRPDNEDAEVVSIDESEVGEKPTQVKPTSSSAHPIKHKAKDSVPATVESSDDEFLTEEPKKVKRRKKKRAEASQVQTRKQREEATIVIGDSDEE